MIETRRVYRQIITGLKNRLEDSQPLTPAQIDRIRRLIGDDALSYMQELGGQLLTDYVVRRLPSETDNSDYLRFMFRYKNRIVRFVGDHSDAMTEARDNKWLHMAFMYESDYLQESMSIRWLKGSNENKDRSRYYLKQRKVGQDNTSIPFLRDMYNLVTRIDPICQIILTSRDSQRTRIYAHAFRDYSNIHIRQSPKK